MDSVKSNFANSIKVYYYYDSHNYLDSVVYSRISSRDVVKLYWEIFTPSVSSFKQTYFNQSNDLNIYPNPSRGHLNIELKKGKTNLNIENVLGQVVKNMELSDETNSVDLSELPHGIYLLNFISYNEIRKIIIY
ncbi:MAG: T9SS type A sorting domain-containing protein [bacterium]|nr:T9SS type A sorting domain-containing protein [bacterium]